MYTCLSLLLADHLLLAEQSNYSSMGRRFRRAGIDFQDLLHLGAWLAVGILAIYAVMRWTSWRNRYHATHASGVFRELCRVHGLNWRERRLLHALARAQQLESPAQLFVAPQRFVLENPGASLRHQEQKLAALRQRLFAKNSGGEVD